jgi:integrase
VTEHVIEWAGGPVASVKHGFHRAATAAGLKDVTPHTLRHTAATWMAQKGVSLWQIAGFLGHSSTAMIEQTYGHHSPDHLAEAARALG